MTDSQTNDVLDKPCAACESRQVIRACYELLLRNPGFHLAVLSLIASNAC